MQDPVDNKKKWQVVGTIVFALLYPFISMALLKLQQEQLLSALVCVLPPTVAIGLLPYRGQVKYTVAVIYFLLMHSALEMYHATLNSGDAGLGLGLIKFFKIFAMPALRGHPKGRLAVI